MAELKKELIVKLDHEEITNIECIKMHGQEMVDTYKEWCEVIGFDEGNEEGAEQFINEWRYDDDSDEMPQEVWDLLQKEGQKQQKEQEKEFLSRSNNGNQDKDAYISAMEVYNEWKKDQDRLKALGNSENAIKVTLWRYQNPNGSKTACKDELGITRNNAKRWWNVRLFIDGAIAGGGHVHFPLGLNYDVMKETILEAIQKAQEDK
jgi:hypothetical protein